MHRAVKTILLTAALLLLLLCILLRTTQHTPTALAAATAQPTLADPDRACARCHAAIYSSYEQTSMARGSGLASEAVKPGSFTSPASGVSYRVQTRDGAVTLTSRRENSNAPLEDTQTLLYFIGSGLHGRTYLFKRDLPGTGSALWYEAPINWYTRRSAYGMAPAFDRAANAPLALPTDANCLHCHATSIADPIEGTANRFREAPFQQGGIGCSACHGNTAAHVASNGKSPLLHLAGLTPKKQDSVCLQCHLEGDALVQRTGRSLARFVPGEDLDDTAVYFVNASSPTSAVRASSQYEGLLRSACRRAAGERLTCVTCHDPHADPAPEQRVAFYRGKCLQCHGDTANFHAATHHADQPDCAHCHMPSRAATDISHTQNADHDIEIHAGTPKLKLNDVFHHATAVDLRPVGTAMASDRELGLAYAQFAAKGDRESFRQAMQKLSQAEKAGHADAVVHQQLGYLLQLANQNELAAQEYQVALKQQAQDTTAVTNLAVLQAQRGQTMDAMKLLESVSQAAPDRTAALLNLAMLQCKSKDATGAKQTLERALTYQPDSLEARAFRSTGDYSGMHCRVF